MLANHHFLVLGVYFILPHEGASTPNRQILGSPPANPTHKHKSLSK